MTAALSNLAAPTTLAGPPLSSHFVMAPMTRAVRAEIPREMPLIVRFSRFKERDYAARIAASPAELEIILAAFAAFAAAGADVLHASQRRFWEPAFDGYQENLAGWAKRLTGLPTITVGSVGIADEDAFS